MKPFLLYSFLFTSLCAVSQENINNYESVNDVATSFKTYAFVGGIRIDSIDARYAQFSSYNFEGGQKKEKRSNLAY